MERPIIFSGEMVRAILEGRKTQTRRIVKFHGQNTLFFQSQAHHDFKTAIPCKKGGWVFWDSEYTKALQAFHDDVYSDLRDGMKCPYGQPGDRLWVRETFQFDNEHGRVFYRADQDNNGNILYLMKGEGGSGGGIGTAKIDKWRPSIHMPRWASRITLEIVSVKVERLQDISEEDAIAEGYIGLECKHTYSEYGCTDCLNTGWIEPPSLDFMLHWNSINGKKYPWELNPFCWVIEFKTIDK